MADDTATDNTYTLLPKRLTTLEQSPTPFSGSIAVLKDSKEECCGYAVSSGSKVIVVKCGEGSGYKHITLEPFSSCGNDDAAYSVDGLTLVTGVRWCYLASGESVLVITSFAGFTVYNADGSLKIFQYRTTHNDKAAVATCVKGITAVGNSICIGSHEGHILVFSLREEGEVEYKQQLEGHNAPLSCLDSSRDGRVASGDEVGVVRVWKDPVRNKESKVIYSESNNQSACVHVCWYRDLIVAGYGNGMLRVLNSKVGGAVIEVSAHSRLVSGLDVAQESGLILTVSEDSTVSVWQLTTGSAPKISLVHNRLVQNSLLSGGVMCDRVGSMFAVIAYGYNHIMEFGKS